MKKILIIFGTRPEAIKMAPLVKKFQKDKENFVTKVCVTAQHREMLDQVLDIFQISPDYDLNIMEYNQDIFSLTSNILLNIKPVIESFNPEIILVHGDTTTTFAVSLSAYYLKIKIGHIEAGLRTWDLYSPWPEEGNRKMTSVLADYHFAPTETSMMNLLNEGVKKESIHITGNTVIDALHFIISRLENNNSLRLKTESSIIQSGFMEIGSKFILVTCHRRENFSQGLFNICKALKIIAENNPDVNILYPVHLNPNVRIPVEEILSNIENINLVEPFQYEEFVYLMSKSYLILTDSGGIQEEAPSLGKPVIVMRDKTERPEAIKAGTVKLVGSCQDKIVKEVQNLLNDSREYQKMSKACNPYGDGIASEKIIEQLKAD